MPVVCIRRENRKKLRVFKAKDVGRIVCYALEDGADPVEMKREISRCLGRDECDCEQAKNLIKLAVAALAAIAFALAEKNPLVRALNVIMRAALKSPNATERALAKAAQGELEDLTKFIETQYRRIADEADAPFASRGTGEEPPPIVISP